MGQITRLVQRYRAGEVDLQAVIDFLQDFPLEGKDPKVEGEEYGEVENPLPFEDSWLEVTGLLDGRLLTMDEYLTIHRAIFGASDPNDPELAVTRAYLEGRL